MTTLRFAGDLPWWIALILALTFSALCWRYYRRERHELQGRLRWLLPLLRSLAFFLVAFILAGPILHHRKVIGELGRVLIYLDGSESMGVTDPHMSIARKLLVAREMGWLPENHIDARAWDLAEKLARTREDAVRELQRDDLNAEGWLACRDQFVAQLEQSVQEWRTVDGNWKTAAANAADKNADGGPDGNQVPLDIRDELVVSIIEQAKLLDPPTFDGVASDEDETPADADAPPPHHSSQTMLQLCDGLRRFEQVLHGAFEETVQQQQVGDDLIRTALARFDKTPRWRRGEYGLLDDDRGVVGKLRKTHDIHVFALADGEATPIWSAAKGIDQPKSLIESPIGKLTNLASGVSAATKRRGIRNSRSGDSKERGDGNRTAVVIVSDGQHNSGPSPQQVAKLLGQQGIPVHAIGTGSRREPPDLAVLDADYPDTIFQKDVVRGSLTIRDKIEAGKPFVVEVRHENEVLWREELITQDVVQRRIEFEFSVDELVDRLQDQIDPNLRQHAVPLTLEASIGPLEEENEVSNNATTMRMSAVTQNYRILIIDGRSRWETRYLRNAFERDTQWEIDVILVGPGTDQATMPRGEEPEMFPAERDQLFDYDLIIIGEVTPEVWQDHELVWIRDFVELKGGGLILIDGQRKSLRGYASEEFNSLVPVTWTDQVPQTLPSKWKLTQRGAGDAAFQLAIEESENRLLWDELPPPHQLNIVEAHADAHVLLEVELDGAESPGMVSRAFGAGRVLYCASDETWRWRYKAADLYHQRFWHQLARSIMARPFAASDEFASLDTGSISYPHGSKADIRVRLMGLDGKPATDTTVDALLWENGQVVSTVNLSADVTVPGIFRGQTSELEDGEYEVTIQASGYSREVLKAKTEFVVEPADSEEFRQIACNEELLTAMSAASGGRFLREEEIGDLVDLLSPLSSGEVVESDIVLWQSYWWFFAIIAILAVEWMLRKRAGMM
jgi:uncharacterized membrane protein